MVMADAFRHSMGMEAIDSADLGLSRSGDLRIAVVHELSMKRA
jgi:hypothetical protein